MTVENGVLSLDQPHPYPKIVAKANNTALTSETVAKYGLYTPELDLTRTTLGGIANAAMYQFRMSTGMGLAPGTDVVILMSQDTATMNLFGFQHQKLHTDYTTQCAQAFTDPSNQILVSSGLCKYASLRHMLTLVCFDTSGGVKRAHVQVLLIHKTCAKSHR